MFILKLKAIFHLIMSVVSCFIMCIMLLETNTALYPATFCWVCTVISGINTLYAFAMFCRCAKKLERKGNK